MSSDVQWRAVALLLISGGPLLLACAPTSSSAEADLQSLCGRTTDLRDVQLYDGSAGVSTRFVSRHRRAVGLLRWKRDLAVRYRDEAGNVAGQGWCTGTLIDDDLFLTAGHCLDNTETGVWSLPHEKGGVPLSASELAREFVVEFGYETPLQPELEVARDTVEVVRLEEYRSGGVDYALLRLSGHPGLRHGVARVSPSDATASSPIAILQHPAALPMKLAVGSVARVDGSRIVYDTIDTLGGSSGAGILDVATGKLVGIHTNGGCTSDGGENYGVTVAALAAVSETIASLSDDSRDFWVGDWDNDGRSDLAVMHEGCFYPDANHDERPDDALKQCPPEPAADDYFVGRWDVAGPSGLAWRRGPCLYLDVQPERPLCFADEAPFDVLVADWNGDGRSDLAIQTGSCFAFDTNLDGIIDERGYCYGNGRSEDEYLTGDWDGSGRDSVAVRRGNNVLIDADRDGNVDHTLVYGNGGNEAQYLVADWRGEQRDTLGVRRKSICLINHDPDGRVADEGRVYRDFWSATGAER